MKLTPTRVAILRQCAKGEAGFYDLMNVGANGQSVSGLVADGYLSERLSNGTRLWSITDIGRSAIAPSGQQASTAKGTKP